MTGNKRLLLIMRSVVVAVILAAYHRVDLAHLVLSTPFLGPPTIVHLIWLTMMLGMVLHLWPNAALGISANKQFGGAYQPASHNGERLEQQLHRLNKGARNVLLLWASIVGTILLLHQSQLIGGSELIVIMSVFYLCDSICMAVWCPLRAMFLSTRCCTDCRIYGWGNFMIYAVLFALPSAFAYSLALMSLLLFVLWEVRYFLHPQRFWTGSNGALRCTQCTEHNCETRLKALADKRKRPETR